MFKQGPDFLFEKKLLFKIIQVEITRVNLFDLPCNNGKAISDLPYNHGNATNDLPCNHGNAMFWYKSA